MRQKLKWDAIPDVVEDAGHYVKKDAHIVVTQIARALVLVTVIPLAKAQLLIIGNNL